MKKCYPFGVFLVMLAAVLACASPLRNGGEPETSSDQVATVVASTLQALTPASSDGGETPEVSPGLLPHILYFTNNDDAGIAQVFRLEMDGTTVTQLTFETSAVDSYDVSQVDGSVAYVAGNQLLLIDADGSDRRVLL